MSQSVPQAAPDALPGEPLSGVALINGDNRFEWVNEQLASMLGQQVAALEGTSPESLPVEQQAWFTSTQSPLEWIDADGEVRWLLPEQHHADEKTLIVLRDITTTQRLRAENLQLQQQLKELKLTDDLTGLPNRRAITQALELQISRSRRYQNPLSIVLVHISVQDDQLELLNRGAAPLVLGISRFLRDRLRWVDQIGRWEENIFLLVLPETELSDARGLVEKIRQEGSGIEVPEPLSDLKPVLSFGVGVWQKGDDLRTLLRAASRDLAAD